MNQVMPAIRPLPAAEVAFGDIIARFPYDAASGAIGLVGTLFIAWKLRKALRPEQQPLVQSNP